MTVDSTKSPVKVEIFSPDLDIDEVARFEHYKGRESHFSIMRSDGTGKFRIRAHDEQRPGGFLLEAEGGCPPGAATVLAVTDPNTLPAGLSAPTDFLAIDLDLSGGNVDLSAYKPTNLTHGGIMRLRKTDNSKNMLVWTDHTGVTYNHVDRRGDHLTLKWHETLGEFFAI